MTGVVTDSTGAVIPGTTVALTNSLTGAKYSQTTDKRGSYRFVNVPPGEGYAVLFTHDGFASKKIDQVLLGVGITRTQDAKLEAGKTETVEVTAGADVTLNTTDASIGNNVDVQLLNDLPVQDRTNGITTLFDLQPGVESNSGAVAGARIDQTAVTVDGLDVNDIAAGSTFAIVGTAPIDSVSQFTGTVAGLGSGLGTGSGGQFQLVTKNGTNKFHGNVNEYHRDTTTVANAWFNNLDGLGRTPLIWNQFGGNVSGPIKKDKLFFFFNFADSRIISSATGEDTVPLPTLTAATPSLNYINATGDDTCRVSAAAPGIGGYITPSCISSLSAAQVAALDPAGIGFDSPLFAFIDSRYPAPNDYSAGDGINTAGYRFTYPTPNIDTTYTARVDYNLSANHKVFARTTLNRQNATQSLPVFPTDPPTHPFIDRSYGYVVGDTWTIGRNMVNQFYYGDEISKYSFPNAYNPTGANQYSFSGLSSPYSGSDGQKRRVPIPVVRDDFEWTHGAHNITAGGSFKFIRTDSNLINNFNFVGEGLSGPVFQGGLDPTVRPTDISGTSTALNDYDNLFAASLGVVGEISTNYDYTATGSALPAGSGSPRNYRYFETEAYVGDTWKVSPKLTIDYGVRYQLYSVPYEAHGEQSVEEYTGATEQTSTLDTYVKDRIAQQNAGNTSNTGLPIYSVILGGKANHGPNLYAPSYKDFAPRLAFSYAVHPKTVINGSAGIVYDRTVINAINFLQDQLSYLFSNSQVDQIGSSTIDSSLASDPRLGTGLSYPSSYIPAPAALTVPYVPYVDGTGAPYGLAAGETNFVISPNLKDPYSINFNFGIQQELPGRMVLKMNYVARLGRRLLADADAGQVIDVPDYTGNSTQSMAQAFAGLTTQLRACQAVGVSTSNCNLTAQPWFENVLLPYGPAYGFGSNTNLIEYLLGQLPLRGDISDSLYNLAYFSYPPVGFGLNNFLPTNIGIPSQFGANAYLTNQGNSNYNAFLVTLSKNLSHGLRFEFNNTWSHSIDNTSESANQNALFSNSGFICDITKPRACRGNSDFDVTDEVTGNFVYDLPFGKNRSFFATSPRYLDEIIGGWSLSGLPSFRTGLSVTPFSYAFIASFDNFDPAIFTGSKGDLKSHVNVENGIVYGFKGGSAGAAKVFSEFRGPVGLEYGSRGQIRGPVAVNLDMGLAKVFPLLPEKGVGLTFRADAYNVLNHPDFGTPGVSLANNTSAYGQIGGTSNGSRVAQFSLRLEF
jgi:hypothetical protein